MSSRYDPLFELVVKQVCGECNHNWMNDLDSDVEPWIFDPYHEARYCDPLRFRRWAIKIAILRTHYDNPLAVQPEDPGALYAGNDIADWHIFVGRLALPDHRHGFGGFGPVAVETGGRIAGITQVSWSLGRIYVTAIRLIDAGTGVPQDLFRGFKGYNRMQGTLVAEVLPTAVQLPSLATLPELFWRQLDSLGFYFTANPRSPICEAIRQFGW